MPSETGSALLQPIAEVKNATASSPLWKNVARESCSKTASSSLAKQRHVPNETRHRGRLSDRRDQPSRSAGAQRLQTGVSDAQVVRAARIVRLSRHPPGRFETGWDEYYLGVLQRPHRRPGHEG